MQWLLTKPHKVILALAIVSMIGASFLFASSTNAAPNYEINYQGKLMNASNVTVADGLYNMRFWLLTSSTIATTSAVWTESLTGSNRVQVTNGVFSVMLGSTSPLTGVDFNQTLYLGVEIGGTGAPVWDGEMGPRKILGAVPAAFEAENAQTLDGIATTSLLRSDQDDTASGLLTFTGGIISSASSTITNLTTLVATTTRLVINGESFTDLTGSGLINTADALTCATSNGATFGCLTAADWTVFNNKVSSSSIDSLSEIETLTGVSNILIEGDIDASSELLALMDDETGTGSLVFSVDPLLQGFRSNASSTIAGLTVAGNSTTTGSAYFGGNVGIGTTTPAGRLSLTGLGTGTGVAFRVADSSDTSRFTVRDDGSVAIASTATGNGLLVSQTGLIDANSGGFAVYSSIAQTNGRGLAYVYSDNAASTIDALRVQQVGTGNLVNFMDGSTSVFVVRDGGNVGVGTTTPVGKLSVTNSGASPALYLSDSANFALRILNPDAGGGYWNITQTDSGYAAGGGKLIFVPDSTTSTNATVTFTNSGSVGIGTTTPTSKLDVYQGDISLTNNYGIHFASSNGLDSNYARILGNSSNGLSLYTADAERVTVTSAGNLGIGTTTPTAKLDILQASGDGLILRNSPSTGVGDPKSSPTFELVSSRYESVHVDAPFTFQNIRTSASTDSQRLAISGYGSGEVMTILNPGNVGIGTTSPNARLSVAGTTFLGGTLTATGTVTLSAYTGGVLTTNGSGVVSASTTIGTSYLDSSVILSTEIDTSSELLTLVTDETGTGSLVFSASPVFTGTTTLAGYTATYGTTTNATSTNLAVTNLRLSALRDSSNSIGTNGMILQTNGSTAQWVATSTLGLGTGSVSSVALSAPTGFAVSGSPITTSGTLSLSYDTGYEGLRTASSTNWNNFLQYTIYPYY
jgi:hypothetical protein